MRRLLFIIPLLMMAYDAVAHFLFAMHPFTWWLENGSFRWWVQFTGTDYPIIDFHYNLFWGAYYTIASMMLLIGILMERP